MSDRWEHHFLAAGQQFTAFWKDYFSTKRKVAYILAEGFDPRMCEAIEKIRDSWNGEGDCLVLKLTYATIDKNMEELVKANRAKLDKLLPAGTIDERTVNVRAGEQRAEGAMQAGLTAQRFVREKDPRDIIVDINAMPKSVALSVLGYALRYADNKQKEGISVNVHVVVAHNPRVDDSMRRQDIQHDPFLLPGFLGEFESEDNKAVDRVIWIPILGPGQMAQMKAIKNEHNPIETCPAVPSPSIDPRKGDDLITNYQDLLIERGQIPRNVLRVSEQDPFEAYQELVTTIKEYGETYELLDGCKVLLSAHSSKLLSVACLLAAYDAGERRLCHGVSVAFVEALGHRYDPAEGTHADPSELFELWLAGDPYIS